MHLRFTLDTRDFTLDPVRHGLKPILRRSGSGRREAGGWRPPCASALLRADGGRGRGGGSWRVAVKLACAGGGGLPELARVTGGCGVWAGGDGIWNGRNHHNDKHLLRVRQIAAGRGGALVYRLHDRCCLRGMYGLKTFMTHAD